MLQRIIILLVFIFPGAFSVVAQDQIIFKTGKKQYVDKIDSVTADSIYYEALFRSTRMGIQNVLGYYLVEDSPENMARSFHNKERKYYLLDSTQYKLEKRKRLEEIEKYRSVISVYLPSNLSKQKYLPGYYITLEGDTVSAQIARFRKDRIHGIACVVRDRVESDYTVLNALQVLGYSVDGKNYVRHLPESQKGTRNYVFMIERVRGRLNLFEKRHCFFDNTSYYLVHKEGSRMMVALPANGSNIIQTYEVASAPGSTGEASTSSRSYIKKDRTFETYMPALVADCPILQMKIHSGFNSLSDISRIVKEYNACE